MGSRTRSQKITCSFRNSLSSISSDPSCDRLLPSSGRLAIPRTELVTHVPTILSRFPRDPHKEDWPARNQNQQRTRCRLHPTARNANCSSSSHESSWLFFHESIREIANPPGFSNRQSSFHLVRDQETTRLPLDRAGDARVPSDTIEGIER